MSGNKYILDTNAIIALLQGNSDILSLTDNAVYIGISIISKLEFLAFSELTTDDISLFHQFENRIEVIGLTAEDNELTENILDIKKKYNIKLPDAIIAAPSIACDAALISADKQLSVIKKLQLIQF